MPSQDKKSASSSSPYIEIAKEFHFEAAHHLPEVPEGHKCRRLHGHSYRFEVRLRGRVDPKLGWLCDFQEIRAATQPLIDRFLDHYYLNDVAGLENPTSENLAIWLWDKLKPSLPDLFQITVYETCTSTCVYKGPVV